MAKFEEREGQLYIDNHKVIAGFESFSGWYWFATEKLDKNTYFGFVQGLEEEWGNFSMLEIQPLILKGQIWPIPKANLVFSGRRH
jgi:hypothetical protein